MKQIEMQKREAGKRSNPGNRPAMGSPSAPSAFSRPEQQPLLVAQSSRGPSPAFNKSMEPPRGKGMQLGSKQKTTDFFDAMKVEEGIEMRESATPVSSSPAVSRAVEPVAPFASADKIHVVIEEKMTVTVDQHGSVKEFEIIGEATLRVGDPEAGKVKLLFKVCDQKAVIKTHPNVDKNAFVSNSVVVLKDATKSFPTNQALAVLKWKLQSSDDSYMPLSST